ncbi:MAG TPA: NAD-dependent epimerase/dehydratase family protein [Acidisarcina sp.]|nr:NAD-dependent epimerase/dehydratase family protein [Acidisarcina sp.]
MSVFLTGASGFLGGRLAEVLVARGEEVVVLARASADMRHLSHLPLRIVRGDLGDLPTLRQAVRDASQIFHCAACSTDWAPLDTYYAANVAGTKNLLLAARDAASLQRFVHVSTSDIYGYPRVPCAESQPMKNIGLPYNSTKCQGEVAVWNERERSGLPIVILRPATIYGPRGKAFVTDIAELLQQGWMATIDSGKAPGGFAYVDNVVDAMLQAATVPEAEGEAFNIADGTGATWADYLSLFAATLGTRRPRINLPFRVAMSVARAMEFPYTHLRFGGRPLLTRHAVYLLGLNQEFPVEKARRILGFSPRVGLAEGIDRSIAWLKACGQA